MTIPFAPRTFVYPLRHKIIITLGLLLLAGALIFIMPKIPNFTGMMKEPEDRAFVILLSGLLASFLIASIINEWTAFITLHHDRIEQRIFLLRATIYRDNIEGWRKSSAWMEGEKIQIQFKRPIWIVFWRWNLFGTSLKKLYAFEAITEWLTPLPDLAQIDEKERAAHIGKIQLFGHTTESRLRNYKITKKLLTYGFIGLFGALYLVSTFKIAPVLAIAIGTFSSPLWMTVALSFVAICLIFIARAPHIFSLFNIKQHDRIILLPFIILPCYLTAIGLLGAYANGQLTITFLNITSVFKNPYFIAMTFGLSCYVFIEKIHPNPILTALWFAPTFALAVAAPATLALNILADTKPAIIHQDEILKISDYDWESWDELFDNKSSRFVLLRHYKANPREIREVILPPAIAAAAKPGDKICVHLYDGFFGIPWHRADNCLAEQPTSSP